MLGKAMRLSAHGAELIAGFEGFRSRPYKDVAGVWTIGFGSTRGVGPDSQSVTRSSALERMRFEVDEVYGLAVNQLRVPLTQNRFDALVSFVYNVGTGGIAAGSGVGRALRAHSMSETAAAMLEWDKARVNGQLMQLPGLTRRRRVEAALFMEPPADSLTGYTPAEVRWIREYDSLVRADDPGTAGRRAALRRAMREQRKRVWRAAVRDGWTPNRRRRYASLLARSG